MRKKEHQFDLLKSHEENISELTRIDNELPISPFQEKFIDVDPHLTSREFEIMHMTLSGFSIYDIALKIDLSPHGVKYRLSSIYEKFRAKNRLELMKRAATKGLQFIAESGVKHNFQLNINMSEQLKREQHERNRERESQEIPDNAEAVQQIRN